MKTKNHLSIIVLFTGLLTTGIVCGEGPGTGSGTESTTSGSGNNMGWQEQTKRTYVLASNGLNLSSGFSVNQNGVSGNFSIGSNLSVIECCKICTIKESWCNYGADDERCPD